LADNHNDNNLHHPAILTPAGTTLVPNPLAVRPA